MKIIVAPDSYKGSLSSVEVANAMELGILRAMPAAEVVKIPMADGGEGTVHAVITAAGGDIRRTVVTGPLGEKITSFYGILHDGKTAVIEMAAASGLTLVPELKRNPLITTTYGTGEFIKQAMDEGCKKLIIGIGGSATNDGGMGMAQALGVKFYGQDGHPLGMGGQELEKIAFIDTRFLHPKIKDTEILVACDVNNPLCGPTGASYVYGPQKGATPEMVEKLDQGLHHYARQLKKYLHKDILNIPGAGAAGGLGGGLMAFLDATLQPGMEIMIQITNLEEKLKNAHLVITGEGKTDEQTTYGKVPIGIANLAKKYHIPVICLSGSIENSGEAFYEKGITALFSIVKGPMHLTDAMAQGFELITQATENLMRLYVGIRNFQPK